MPKMDRIFLWENVVREKDPDQMQIKPFIHPNCCGRDFGIR